MEADLGSADLRVGQDPPIPLDVFNRYLLSDSAFILLILPFTFAYISEYQKEMNKVLAGKPYSTQLNMGISCDIGIHLLWPLFIKKAA